MNVEHTSGRSSGPLDLRTALTVRTWCDEQFASAYEADRDAAIRKFLEDNGLDQSLASSLHGDLPVSPIGYEEKKPDLLAVIHTLSDCYTYDCDTSDYFCPGNTNYCVTMPGDCENTNFCNTSSDCPPPVTVTANGYSCA